MHSTDDLDDGYLGSGQVLWKSLRKHGKHNHSFEILEYHADRKSLSNREEQILTEEIRKHPLCMNLRGGGTGNYPGQSVPEDVRRKISEAHKGRTVTWGDKISKARTGMKFSDEHRENISKVQKGRKLSTEHKKKIGEGCKGKPATNKRPIIVNGVEYPDFYTASEITGIKVSTIGKRILSSSVKFADTYYKDTPKII